jgi:hypothetical protein
LVVGAVLAAGPALADPSPGPESPPPPWFVIADIPSHDPAYITDRSLWSREDNALRHCRKPADKDEWTCAGDVALPTGRWVLQRIQDKPEAGIASSARFYRNLDRTLRCHASDDGAFSRE